MNDTKGCLYLKDVAAGVIFGIIAAIFVFFSYNLIMESIVGSYLDILTVEAYELYINYPLLLMLFSIVMILAWYVKKRYFLTGYFYVIAAVACSMASWPIVPAAVFVAILKIKYMIS